jgi:hypothetical protein
MSRQLLTDQREWRRKKIKIGGEFNEFGSETEENSRRQLGERRSCKGNVFRYR